MVEDKEDDVVEEEIVGEKEQKKKATNDDVEFYEAKEVGEHEQLGSTASKEPLPDALVDDHTLPTTGDREIIPKPPSPPSRSQMPSSPKTRSLKQVEDAGSSPPRSPPRSPAGAVGTRSPLSFVQEGDEDREGRLTSSISPRDEPEGVLSISSGTCPACLGSNEGSEEQTDANGGGGRCQACCDKGAEPLDFVALGGMHDEVAVAINSLRVQLGLACRQKGVAEGAQKLEEALQGRDREGIGAISPSDFARALEELNVQVRKREVRPILAEELLTAAMGDGVRIGVRYAAVARMINGARWWPTKREIRHYLNDLVRLRAELDALLGSRIAAVVCRGQDAQHLQEILEQAKSHPQALEELKMFLSAIPIPPDEEAELHEAFRPATGSTHASRRSLKKPKAGAPYGQSISRGFPGRPMSVPLSSRSPDPDYDEEVSFVHPPPKSTKPFLPSVTTPAPKAKVLFPYEDLPKKLAKSEYLWETWTNTVTGKVHAPQLKRRGSLGSSSRRSGEYAKSLATMLTPQREKTKANRDKIWRKSKFPAHAVQYVRWQGGGQKRSKGEMLMPGFDMRVPSTVVHETEWFEKVVRRPLRMGSRYTDPVSGTFEELTTTTQLMDTLKNERIKSNLALEATDILKGVRLWVIRGNYDKALGETKECLARYLRSGKYGEAMAHDLGEPLEHVTKLIKHQVDKLVLVAKDSLTRGSYDLALAQIPTLRDACLWLRRWKVTYPEAREATHWELRKGITRNDFPQGMEVIDKLTLEITNAQSVQSLEKDLESAGAVYAKLRPAVDEKDEEMLAQLLDDPSKRNRLPEDVIADGRTYLFLLDVKPPELPPDLELGTQIVVRGERQLGSGRQVDATEEMTGAITSWNNRAGKYKVAYGDDYEWIAWPTHLQVEIVTQPEDVALEAPGLFVRCSTHQHTKLGDKVVMCAFAVVPSGPPFDLSKMNRTVPFTATGVRTGNMLLGDDPASVEKAAACGNRKGSIAVNVLPPDLLRPAKRYTVRDALSNELLPGATVSFRHTTDPSVPIVVVQNWEDVQLDQEGVYAAVVSGGGLDGCPWSLVHMNIVWAGGLMRAEQDVMLSRQVQSHEDLRIVISWAKAPTEIDTHIYLSSGEDVSWEMGGTSVSGVKLEMDVVTGAGPETATIRVKHTLAYSLSLQLVGEGEEARTWDETQARVDLYDHTGLIASFQAPKGRKAAQTDARWWHVFALDGSTWKRPSKGVLRVNQVSKAALPNLAVPGWTLFEAARRGHWDDLCEQLDLVSKGRVADLQLHTGQPLMCPHRLANLTSASGETLLSLICGHDETPGEDPARGNERLEVPLERQSQALDLLLTLTVDLEKRARTPQANEMGIPTEDAWTREVKKLGVRNGFLYKLAANASARIAVQVLNILSPMVKRLSSSSPLKAFVHAHGEDLLLSCVTSRHHSSVVPVLTALLSIDAVWERRQKRRLQTNDHVQIEVVKMSGEWHNAVIYSKTAETYEVVVCEEADHQLRDCGVQSDPLPGEENPQDKFSYATGNAEGWWREKPNLSDLVRGVAPSKIKLRSRALEKLQVLYKEALHAVKQIDFNSRLSVQNKDLLQAEKNYKDAVMLVQEKMFTYLYAQ